MVGCFFYLSEMLAHTKNTILTEFSLCPVKLSILLEHIQYAVNVNGGRFTNANILNNRYLISDSMQMQVTVEMMTVATLLVNTFYRFPTFCS